jgi:DNA-binding HxlR family transcriptional regulator
VRTYGQFCPIARASEILAERWTPIILRNILDGCATFNEIAAGAPGLSRALLVRRLHELELAGVIEVRPKPEGRGSLYLPTDAGHGLRPVLGALGAWAERFTQVRPEHSDPGVILWSWSRNVRADRAPDRRVQVRFDWPHRGAVLRSWLLVGDGPAEVCNIDPGFGDDLVVTIVDTVAFARWHLGIVAWGVLLRREAVRVEGPSGLRAALPGWNGEPEINAWLRAGGPAGAAGPPPPGAERLMGGPGPAVGAH